MQTHTIYTALMGHQIGVIERVFSICNFIKIYEKVYQISDRMSDIGREFVGTLDEGISI